MNRVIQDINVLNLIGLIAQILTFFILFILTGKTVVERIFYSLILSVMGAALAIQTFAFFGVSIEIFNLILLSVNIFLVYKYKNKITRDLNNFIKITKNDIFVIIVLTFVMTYLYFFSLNSQMINIDGLLYHGPLLANMVQNKFWNMNLLNQYSYYTEIGLYSTLNLVKSTEWVVFDDAVSIPYFIILTFAIVLVLKKLTNYKESILFLFSLAILSAPIIWMQNKVLGNDLSYAASIICLLYIAAVIEPKNKIEIVSLIVVVGFMLGSRPNAIIFTTFIAPFLILWLIYIKKLKPKNMIVGLAASLFIGSLSLIRNQIEFKNFLYPIETKIMGIVLEGPVSQELYKDLGTTENKLISVQRLFDFISSIHMGITNNVSKFDYDPRETGFGRVIAYIVISILISMFIGLFQKNLVKPSTKLTPIIPIAGFVLIIYLLTQRNTSDSRYAITAYILISIIIISFLSRFKVNLWVLHISISMVVIYSVYYNEINLDPKGFKNLTEGIKYGNEVAGFEWLSQEGECKRLIIQTNGGLAESGMQETGTLNILNYPFFGNRLCNSVYTFTNQNKDISGKEISKEKWANILINGDYLVIYTQEENKVIQSLEKKVSNLNLAKLQVVEPVIDHWLVRPDGQTIYSIKKFVK
jgi:hypothetical protein